MIKDKMVVIGGGGHAKVVASIVKKLGTFEILGYTDNKDRGPLLSMSYLGTDEMLPDLKEQYPHLCAALGIGYLGEGDVRERLVKNLHTIGITIPAIISPAALINEEVEIGEGTVVMDGVVVNSGTHIGKYVIINTHASIDHDCEIGDFSHIAPGVTFSGGVKIGARSFVGVGATIVQYKTVGDQCIIGAGAVVTGDCLESGVYVGIPARRQIT